MTRTQKQLTFVVVAGLFIGSCGPPTRTEIIPGLPGDGTANTAKPSAVADTVEEAPSDPWSGREDLIKPPAALPPKAIDLPPIERFTLPNGLPVVVIKNPRLPVVDVRLAVKVGQADDPRDKKGLAQFAALMLTKGTRTRNAATIAESIDYVGGSLGAEAGHEATVLSCSARIKSLRTCMTLLPDIAMNARFPLSEMDEIKRRLQAVVRQRKDNAGQLATVHLLNALWGAEHVRGWPLSARTIDAIQQKDLIAWYRKWFMPNNAVLVVAGNVDSKRVRLEVQRTLRWWPRRKAPEHKSYSDPALAGVKIRLVDKPGQTQSHIRVGHLGISHRDPAFFDHLVFNYALGGGAFSSRLMKVVRSEKGKAYGASSRFDRNVARGAFVASTFTRSAETVTTLQLILAELAKMRAQGPTAGEVTDAITNLTGSYAMRFESASDVAGAVLSAELHGLGETYVRDYPLSVAKVTVESARKAAAKTLDTENLIIVIVGDGGQVEPQLKKIGLPYEKVGHLEPVAGWERRLASAPADPKSEAAGRALLDKALAAKGGVDRLRKIKRLTLKANGKIVLGQQELPATLTRRFMAPDKLRLDIDIQLGGQVTNVVTILNGDKGWNKQPQTGLIDLPQDAISELRNQVWRDQELVLLRHKEKGTKVQSLGEKSRQGRAYHAVQMTRGDGRVSVVVYLDKEDHVAGLHDL